MAHIKIKPILKDYKNGKSIKSISKTFKHSGKTIKKVLIDNNVFVKSSKAPCPKADSLIEGCTFIEEVYKIGKKAKILYWRLKCKCGNIFETTKSNFIFNKFYHCGCKASVSYGKAAKNKIYSKYKKRAKDGKFKFNISKGVFFELTESKCYYCDSPPKNVAKNNWGQKGKYIYNGLDRVDSFRGYTIDNVVPCCFDCNRAKNNLSSGNFFQLVGKIYKKHMEKISG